MSSHACKRSWASVLRDDDVFVLRGVQRLLGMSNPADAARPVGLVFTIPTAARRRHRPTAGNQPCLASACSV